MKRRARRSPCAAKKKRMTIATSQIRILCDLHIDDEWKARVRASIPELPDARKARYIEQILACLLMMRKSSRLPRSWPTSSRKACSYTKDAKAVANWIMGDLLGYLNANNLELADVKITGQGLGEMIGLIEKGTISSKIAKTVFKEMLETGKAPQVIVEEQGLVQISDEGAIKAIVEQVIANNPQSVADFKAGKEKAIGFLVGQVMKETKGKANPGLVNKLILEAINSQ